MSKGQIPPEIIEEIKDRTDIVSFIETYVPLQKKGRNFWGLCPFHLEDTPSFSVSQEKQIFKCFGCGKGGNVVNFLMDYENLSFPEALRKLGERAGIAIPEREMSSREKQYYDERKKLIAVNESAIAYFSEALHHSAICRDYLGLRGVSSEMIKDFSLGFAPESWDGLKNHLKREGFTEPDMLKAGVVSKSDNGRIFDRFRNRLMFPIYDVKGSAIAFVGRVIDDSKQAKYVNTEGTVLYHKGRNLYALNLAHSKMRELGEGVLMEGNLDVISAHQFGVTNAVAPQGTALTQEQALTLKRYCSKIYLAYDSDDAGKKATLKNMDILFDVGLRVNVMEMPEGMDPDDVFHKRGVEAWNRLQKDSIPYMAYKIKIAFETFDIHTAEGKAEAVKALGSSLFAIKDNVERNEYIRKIAQGLDIEEQLLHMDMQRKGAGRLGNFGSGIDFSAPPKENSFLVAEDYLVRAAVESKKVFDAIEAEEGWDFLEKELHCQIIALIRENYQEFTWHFRDLSDFAPEELAAEILTMALAESPMGDEVNTALVEDCRRRIHKDFLQKELKDLTSRLKSGSEDKNLEEERRLLQKFEKIQKELRKL